MKKIYQKPEMTVTKVMNTEIICMSPTQGFKPGEAPKTGVTSGNLTKDRGDYVEDEVSFGDLW